MARFLLVAFLLPLAIFPPSLSADDHDEFEGPAQWIQGDDLYVAATSILLSDYLGDTGDDVFLGGTTIHVDVPVPSDLWAAGTTIDINAEVGSDLRAGGTTVTIRENIQGSALVGATDVIVKGDATLRDGGAMAANRIEFEGNSGARTFLAGSLVSVNGTFEGDLTAFAEDTILGPNAVIRGGLTLAEGTNLDRHADAVVEGSISYEAVRGNVGVRIWFQVAGLLSSVFILLLGIYLTPRLIRSPVSQLRKSWSYSLLVGFLAIILIPIIMGLGFAIGIGFGVSLALFAGLSVAFFLAAPVVATWISQLINKSLEGSRGNWFLWGTVYLLVINLLSLVPILNFFVMLAVVLFGFGAMLRAAWMNARLPVDTVPADSAA